MTRRVSAPVFHVIASGAKQSISRLAETWIASSQEAPRNDGVGFDLHCQTARGCTFAFSRHGLPEACGSFRPLENEEGAGKAGCALHPRSRVQVCAKKCAHEHTGEAEALRLSLRDGLTAYFGLSPVNGLCCHRRPQKPGFLRTWRQHRGARTTRLRRTRRLRSSVTALASTASHRAFVTIATRPSHRVRRAESKTNSPPSLSDLFFSEGLDEANRVDIAGEFSLNAHAAIELKSPPPHRLATGTNIVGIEALQSNGRSSARTSNCGLTQRSASMNLCRTLGGSGHRSVAFLRHHPAERSHVARSFRPNPELSASPSPSSPPLPDSPSPNPGAAALAGFHAAPSRTAR